MKKFFGIEKNHYVFEIADLFTLITILNVTLVLCGLWFAPIIGIINCVLCILNNIRVKGVHINSYVTSISFIVLNIYFLTL